MRHAVVIAMTVAVVGTFGVSRPAAAWRSNAMSIRCNLPEDTAEQRRHDQRWLNEITAFLPETTSDSLRITSLTEESQQVLLALRSIRSTCSDYRAGKTSPADADNWLSGFEQTVRDFVHDRGNDALVKAGAGQVSSMDSIREALTKVAGVGRQAALLGEDAIADEARDALNNTLKTFNAALATARTRYSTGTYPWGLVAKRP